MEQQVIKDRIKQVRKSQKLTQQNFGDLLGVKQNTIAGYEMGIREPSSAIITLICREFNVNERWLRFGDGEMFVTYNRNDEITKWASRLAKKNDNDFSKRFASMLARLDENQWELLEKMTLMLYDDKEKD